jgi:peptidoglycan-associated lipoprotein
MTMRVTPLFSMSRPRPRLFTLALALAVAVGGAGCASPGMSRKAHAPAAPAGQGAATAVGQATTTSAGLDPNAAGKGETFALKTQGLAVSDAIAQACGITPRDPAQKASAARFEFDSAALSEDDRAMLGQVARCLADGALRDRKVVLTGRADPRGEPEYNMTLGGSRSDAVLRYMVDLGVGRPRMTATSRGEIDAVGKDEASWAHDRRVDVELAP